MRLDEIAKLAWDRVKIKDVYIQLETPCTKNKKAQTVYFDDELKQVFQEQWENQKAVGHLLLLSFVFINQTGKHRIKRFVRAWEKACINAVIDNRIFHGFKRSSIRNMLRSDIPEWVTMIISAVVSSLFQATSTTLALNSELYLFRFLPIVKSFHFGLTQSLTHCPVFGGNSHQDTRSAHFLSDITSWMKSSCRKLQSSMPHNLKLKWAQIRTQSVI